MLFGAQYVIGQCNTCGKSHCIHVHRTNSPELHQWQVCDMGFARFVLSKTNTLVRISSLCESDAVWCSLAQSFVSFCLILTISDYFWLTNWFEQRFCHNIELKEGTSVLNNVHAYLVWLQGWNTWLHVACVWLSWVQILILEYLGIKNHRRQASVWHGCCLLSQGSDWLSSHAQPMCGLVGPWRAYFWDPRRHESFFDVISYKVC